MERKMDIIKPNPFLKSNPFAIKKKRVVAYARVSTSSKEQLHSFKAQKEYYENYISNHKDWIFCGLYADEGLSGLSLKNRVEFNRMIADGLNGKFDMIITKSISRFARNTVDNLEQIRKLKSKGVAIYFEENDINTLLRHFF